MTIGRDPSCHLVLEDEEVALQHAELSHAGDLLFIKDLGTMNRILVNKREVRESKLKHGDVAELGRTRFLVQALVQAEVGSLPPVPERSSRPVVPIVAAVLLVAATVGAYMWWVFGGTHPVDDFVRAPVTNAEASGASEPPAQEAVAVEPVVDGVATDITVADVEGAVADITLAPVEPVSDEIRSMREEIASLRQTMLTLASRDPEPDRESAVLQPPPIVDALRQKTEELMGDARRAMDEGRWVDADQILAGIQAVDPTFVDSFLARAEMYERRGMLKRAMEQWSLVAERAVDVTLAERAAAERLRIQKAGQATVASRQVMISAVEQQKFPESEDYDEMRLLKITLRQAEMVEPIDTDALRIDVVFFEEEGDGGTVRVSRVETARSVVKLDTPWDPSAREQTVSATYIVPKGFREKEATAGASGRYHGYVVGVYYHDVLQDEDARPRTLLFRGAEEELGTSIGGKSIVPKDKTDDRES